MTSQAQPGSISYDADVPCKPPSDLAWSCVAPALGLCPHLVVIIDFVLSASPPGLVSWRELEASGILLKASGDLTKMQIHQIQVEKCKGRALVFCISNNLMVLMLLICQPHLGSKVIGGLFHL